MLPGSDAVTGGGMRSPFDETLGVVIDEVTDVMVAGHLDVDPVRHMQPAGAVHGGVYCSMVETLASVGAASSALPAGRRPVGMENHTSFLRPVTAGRLRGVARAVSRGRQTHLWEVMVTDDQERPVARGSVRLALLEPRGEPSAG